MPITYTRTETDQEIVISYKYQAGWYVVLAVAILLPVLEIDYRIESAIITALFALLFLALIEKIKPTRELNKAMKTGKIVASGSRFSFKNPLTFKIQK